MFTVCPITDFDDPRLAPFRNMRAQIDHLNSGVFVAEGDKVIRRLLESPLRVRSVLLPSKWEVEFRSILQERREDLDLFVADKPLLERLTGFALYQGVLGLAEVPPPCSFDALLELPRPWLFAAVDGLSNAENIGAVVRSAAALGVQALIVGETCAHPYLRRAVRISMGTIFNLPYLLSANLTEALGQLQRAGVRTIAAHPHADRRTLWDCDFSRDTCIVLGAEGDGLRPGVLAACDQAALIPMAAGVDSLNVAAAAGVFFTEAARQRRAQGNR